jgi:hypothetical protein
MLHARYHNDAFFFVDGFGDQDLLSQSLVQRPLPAPPKSKPLKKEERERILRFPSPRIDDLPEESKFAEALVVMPPEWTLETPVCVQLAATGDEGFMDRRRVVAEPLLEFGIGSVILENPLYGCRRPKEQDRTYLRTVSDLWIMGMAVVAETRALLEWLRGQGFVNLGVCGVSMGGAMVGQAAALTPYPLAVCACIAPHCATPVFLEGVLSKYVDWEALGEGGRERLGRQLDGSDLRIFPKPPRPDCAVWLGAKRDAYVDPASCMLTAQAWPGSKMKWLNNGHVGTALFHRNQYIRCIQESFRSLTGPAHKMGVWLP